MTTFTDPIPEEWYHLPQEPNPHKRLDLILTRAPRVLDAIENRIDASTAKFDQLDAVLEIEYKEEKVSVMKAMKTQNIEWCRLKEEVARWERGKKLWTNEWVSARKKFNN